VQKHAASSLPYDFGLEAGGVLKSWAVPKGPSLDPAVKRLAVPTEDHALEHATFEGLVPRGQFGHGAVIVWDAGTYENTTTRNGRRVDVAEAVEEGHVSVWLNGDKLQGGFALTRTRRGKLDWWLLVKKRDEAANPSHDILRSRPGSVQSGLTLEAILAQDS
jgi:DNA ligase D-like protein (predicted 3'-phosphoesterase)